MNPNVAIFAGPMPDDNLTLTQARVYRDRLAVLFPNNLATILVVGPANTASYFNAGNQPNYQLLGTIYSEQDMLDAGLNPDVDPVWASFKFANVASSTSYAKRIGFEMDRGNFTHVAMDIFGINVNVEMALMQAESAAMQSGSKLTVAQIMEGKTAVPPAPVPAVNPSNIFGPGHGV